ncbi:isochorismatase [Colletotrichum costaricense]|uniref:nicotinamidase n=1 Tax=Colletotrichum costaricense TaxID=1209916 RepID=A0AAI9YXV8_9PEZI|nr:isochorismatase [Colletotrichum costaricense]KAK1528474.1 isochorismatase [Colletotrichum costaricense]
MSEDLFRPALIVVDFQEDFCPPNGSLAVANGRDIHPVVNSLLRLPFTIKIATKDWHPQDHISFASNHDGKQPFVDAIDIVNPRNSAETFHTRLWPVHCVQGTPGAALVPELDASAVDTVIEKGQNKDVEMYSVFYDPFQSPRVSDSGLAASLKDKRVTDVYVVGLAGDYCVKCTALDAQKEGFRTFIVEEGTRPVDAEKWDECKGALEASGVKIISMEGPEVQQRPTMLPCSLQDRLCDEFGISVVSETDGVWGTAELGLPASASMVYTLGTCIDTALDRLHSVFVDILSLV